jgi:putative transposase
MNGKTTYGPKIRRRSIRLPGYDYAEAGFYFVTICTKENKSVFGDIAYENMILNDWGFIVRDELLKTPQIRPNVRIPAWIVMPNHVHFIIEIRDRTGTPLACPSNPRAPSYGHAAGVPLQCKNSRICRRSAPLACPDDATSPVYAEGTPTACPYDGARAIRTGNHLLPPKSAHAIRHFGGSAPNTVSSIVSQYKSAVTKRIRFHAGYPVDAWHRNYWERVIRSEQELFDTAEYIRNNPKNWRKDWFYENYPP